MKTSCFYHVTVRSAESFEVLLTQSGSIAGDWEPRTNRGTVVFGSAQCAAEARKTVYTEP